MAEIALPNFSGGGITTLFTWANTVTSGAFWPVMTIVVFAVSCLTGIYWPMKKTLLFACFTSTISAFILMLGGWVAPWIFIVYLILTAAMLFVNSL